jgi:hypothetical protein
LSTAVHGAQVVGSVITTRQGWEGRWVYGLDHNGESGGDKRGKDKVGTKVHTRTQGVRSRPVYGAEGLWLLTFLPSRGVCKPHKTFSPTHTDKLSQAVLQGRGSTQQQQVGREERSKLAKASQEGERVVKVTDKEWGEGNKNGGVRKKRKTIGGMVKGTKRCSKKP